MALGVFSGRRIPVLVLEGGIIFSTNMRLNVGIKRFAIFTPLQPSHALTESRERKSDSRTVST